MKKWIIIFLMVMAMVEVVNTIPFVDIQNRTTTTSSKTITQINGSIEWNIIKNGAEQYLDVEYEILNDTTTEFCVGISERKSYEDALILDNKNIKQVPTKKIKSSSLFRIEKNNLDLSKDRNCFAVTYEELVLDMEFRIGWNSVTVSTSIVEGGGGWKESWNHRIFYDPNNNRWHILYIDSGGDIHTYSSEDGITWIDGIIIESLTFGNSAYDNFDCSLDIDGSNTYLHCAFASSRNDFVEYERATLTGTTPFISAGDRDIPFDSSLQEGSSNDDVEYPRITLDSNRCVLIAFGFEDDSEATVDEHELVLIKEASSTTCGDGDWDGATDTETGFPIFSIQSNLGFNVAFALGIESFGDLDAQIFWINNTFSSSYALESAYFNGTSNSVGQEITLEPDVEGSTTFNSYWSVIIGERIITFAMDDGTQDLDAYITIVKNGTLSSQIDTGIDMDDQSFTAAYVTAIVDTRADGADDIWVFAVDDADDEDIWYSVSTDGGDSWGSQTLWQDEAGKEEVKFLSAYFDNETCDISVIWLNNTLSPFGTQVDIINTGNCPDEAPPTYSNQKQNVSTFLVDSTIQFNATISDADNSVLNWNFSTNLTAGETWNNITNSTDLTDPSQVNVSIVGKSVGDVFGYMFCASDNQGNVGCDTLNTFTISTSDSCTYSSGDWNVDCSDNCKITSAVDLGGNDITITGTGTFLTTARISNYGDIRIEGTDVNNICSVRCEGECFED